MRALVAFLLFATSLLAAPVPKALKKQPLYDGVWECVEFNGYNGKMRGTR